MLEGRETSRKHAEIRLDGPVAVVRDLGSRNGVFVNGTRIQQSPLGPGDVVRVGDWIAVVAAEADQADGSFRSVAPGWYGSARLASAIEPGMRAATTDLPITIQGETGVGKEGAARALHVWSGRTGQFVAVNCAALPAELAEAELFGYRRGAFTGADRAGVGCFRAAHRGTLFLDEVLELAPALQAKLLRVVEQREVCPLGEHRAVPVDVRILAASQEPLRDAVEQRRFRLDLRARLEGVVIHLPPLRQRREDIVPLFLQVLSERSGGRPPEVEPRLLEQLLLYDWPLNVREIVLLARRLLAGLAGTAPLRRSLLPEHILQAGRAGSPAPAAGTRAPSDDARAFEALVQAIRHHAGNVTRAAAALGISRSRAYRMLDAHPGFLASSLREGSAR